MRVVSESDETLQGIYRFESLGAQHVDSILRGLTVKSDKRSTLYSLMVIAGIVLLGGGMTACSDDPKGSDPFNNSEPNPCSDVECPDGESCVVDGDEGVCEPDANNHEDLCDGVSCDEGQSCDPDSGDCVDDDVDLCEGVECGEFEYCEEESGDCVEIDADPGYTCQSPEGLGTFSGDESRTVTATPGDQPSTERTECSNVDSGNAVFEFTAEDPMDVHIQLTDQADDAQLVLEVRQGSCSDDDAVIAQPGCDNIYNHEDSTYSFDAEAGETYYIIVEGRDVTSPGEFTLDIETDELVCAPKGAWTCHPDDDDTIVECDRGVEEIEKPCGYGCEDDACLGDTCENAIEVTAGITVEGHTRPYTNTFDFQPHPECSTEGATGTEGPLSDGRDMVFFLPGLEAGQMVIADGSDTPQLNYFGVVQECDAANIACIHGESLNQVMEWEVPESGDYYVIINRNTSNAGDFKYSIDILD